MTWSSASAHRLLCDLKFCISASTHGIFFGLKFRLRTRNILRLKVPQFRFRIQNSVWLRSSEMAQFRFAQGKYCDLEVTQFRFHTINLVRLEVSQFRFHTRALTFKSLNSASAQRISCDLKFCFRTRNILCLEVQQFCFRTQNNLWLEVPQFSTTYCDLNFRSSASAKKDVIWNSALLLLHVNITFLWKIHSHSTTHPFLNFRDVLHDWWTLWRTEKQSNREAPGKSRR